MKLMMTAAAIAALMLAGCASEPKTETADPAAESAPAAMSAKAEMKDKDGTVIGMATFEQADGGVNMSIEAKGLTPGEHGFHVHETGVCEAPAFTSAGGHFNPTGKAHGKDAEGGHHLGDLLNLEADASGMGKATRMIEGATLGEGETSLVGKAVIIHDKPDDYKTQPTGDAGGRVACGVIMK